MTATFNPCELRGIEFIVLASPEPGWPQFRGPQRDGAPAFEPLAYTPK